MLRQTPDRSGLCFALVIAFVLTSGAHVGTPLCYGQTISSPDSGSRLIGTVLTPENWRELSLVDETHLGIVRIGIKPDLFSAYAADPSRFNWRPIDEVIGANVKRTILITISPSYPRPGGETGVPATQREQDTFIDFVSYIAQHHPNVIKYWQLENEIVNPKNWPPDRYTDYAKLLAAFHDAIRKSNPEARIVIAGVPERFVDGPLLSKLLQAIAEGAAGKVQVIDLHYHMSWFEADAIGDSISALRRNLSSFPALSKLEIVVAENSTWFDKPARQSYQTESQQAFYAVVSIYSALAHGAQFCFFGTLTDRQNWRAKGVHKFSLNGIFFNPEKQYSTGGHRGGKRVAFAMRLMAELTKGVAPEQITEANSGAANVHRVDVAGARPYSVLWSSSEGPTIDVQLPVPPDTKTARVLEALPEKDLNWPPTDPFAGFRYTLVPAQRGMVTVRLNPVTPVYVLPEKQ